MTDVSHCQQQQSYSGLRWLHLDDQTQPTFKYKDLAEAESNAIVNKLIFQTKSMYFNLNSNFPVEKNWSWACDQLKSSNLLAENSKEILNYDGSTLSQRYGHVILFSGYPVWQLSIDHNMDVQYQVASHTSQIVCHFITLCDLWCGQTEGCTATLLPREFPGWTDKQIFLAMGLRIWEHEWSSSMDQYLRKFQWSIKL